VTTVAQVVDHATADLGYTEQPPGSSFTL